MVSFCYTPFHQICPAVLSVVPRRNHDLKKEKKKKNLKHLADPHDLLFLQTDADSL